MFLSGGRKKSRFVADQIEKKIQVVLLSTKSSHQQRQQSTCTRSIIITKSCRNNSIGNPPTGIVSFHQTTIKNSTIMMKELRRFSSSCSYCRINPIQIQSIKIPPRQGISNNRRQASYQMMSNHNHHHNHHHHYQQQRRTFLTSTKEDDDTSTRAAEPSPKRRLWEEMSPETQKLAEAISSSTSASTTTTTTTPPENNMNNTFVDDDDGDDGDDKRQQKRKRKMMHPRVAISRAITLMESKHPFKKKQGDLLLTYLLSLSSSSNKSNNDNNNIMNDQNTTIRVGFAGPPGAGKSCMMEAFGMKLLQQDPDLKLAVVCIDPSSSISGGSILGDKTRMTQLSRQVDRAFVRPSSNSGILGGLAAYTDDVVRLLGCAGYPLVFVETVGLGQSEMEVAQSVDVLVLLIPPSGGDELQGVKKGIVEMANILAVTKTDGDLENAAYRTASDYKGALSVLQQSSSSRGSDQSCVGHGNSNIWKPPVILTSSVSERGLDDLWQAILRYKQHLLDTEKWDSRRRKQSQYWMWKQFNRMMQSKMQQDPRLREKAKQLEREMLDGLLTPRVAAQELLDGIFDIVDHK